MTDEQLKEVKRMLKEKGIRISISGCGCCGSPTVDLEIDGILLIDDEDNLCMSMFNPESNGEAA